jgi:hypothetical protein
VSALASIWSALASFEEIDLLRRIREGELVTNSQIVASDEQVAGSTVAILICVFVTGILWLVWQHRAQTNVLGRRTGLRFTPGWAVGWWFVPIANLWKPFQAMSELRRASEHRDGWAMASAWPVMGFWWAGWIASAALTRVSAAQAGGTADIDDFIASDVTWIIAMLVDISTAVLAALVVLRIARAQEALTEESSIAPPRPDEQPVP